MKRRIRDRRCSRSIKQWNIPTSWLVLAIFCCYWSSNCHYLSCHYYSGQIRSVGFAYAQESELEPSATGNHSSGNLRAVSYVKKEKERPSSSTKRAFRLNQILLKAGQKGLGGGIPGAIAGVFQVLALMWVRTIVNYQSRYGTTFTQAFVTLRKEGGLPRFYRGLTFALIQAPLSRFVSTFSNESINSLMASLTDWGPGRTTAIASIVVGLWRIALMPVDTCKTVLQVDSLEGFRNLMRRVKAGKISVLYQGAIATSVAGIIGHYPWFYTYNILSNSSIVERLITNTLLRNAGIGLVASVVADTVVNAIRVVKTTKQSVGSKHQVSYIETIRMILAADGWRGLFGRGLTTRILCNALQSILFTVIWRGIAEHWGKEPEVPVVGPTLQEENVAPEADNETRVQV